MLLDNVECTRRIIRHLREGGGGYLCILIGPDFAHTWERLEGDPATVRQWMQARHRDGLPDEDKVRIHLLLHGDPRILRGRGNYSSYSRARFLEAALEAAYQAVRAEEEGAAVSRHAPDDLTLRPGYPAPGTVLLHGNAPGAGAMRMNERGSMPKKYRGEK